MKLALKPENLAQLVFLIRGEKVMLDVDLARLYGVSTKALNQAFRRNKQRFPSDFAFQLSKEEFDHLRSQIVTTSPADCSCPARHQVGKITGWPKIYASCLTNAQLSMAAS
jgi:ORF6N domain-containing protein